MKPPFRYYGGKQKLAHHIIPLIPVHTVYVEPFCGGASLLFMKPLPDVSNDHYKEVINDTNKHVVNFFRVLRDRELGPELVRQLLMTPYSESEHKLSKELDIDEPIEAARRFFVNINQSFSGTLCNGWSRAMLSGNHPYTWRNKTSRLHEYIERLSRVYISCQDALDCIKTWDSPQTFFYCDPPYPGSHQGHYSGYTVEDFQKLIEVLDGVEGSFLLSCYEVEGVEIPKNWEKFQFDVPLNAKKVSRNEKRPRRVEVLYRRFNRVPVPPKIQKLYDSGAYDCFVRQAQRTEQKTIDSLGDEA